MRLASFNVNSLGARRPILERWLKSGDFDIVCLQETKCRDDAFPQDLLTDFGYEAAIHGQKSYNGVAVLSKHPIAERQRGLPGLAPDPDLGTQQARYLEVETAGLIVASIYLPNGNPVLDDPAESPKFTYKLTWMDHLLRRAAELLALERPVVLAGDYNAIPYDEDVYDPVAFRHDALTRPETRARYFRLLHAGYTDAIAAMHGPGAYTYWDYQGGAWQWDKGLRIDHLLLSPEAGDRLIDCGVDKTPRGWPKASDHTPVWCALAD